MGCRVEHGPLGVVSMSEVPMGDSSQVAAVIESLMREVPDFPEPGIQFKDLTPVLADARGLSTVTDALAAVAGDVDLVAGIDARGFLLGAAVAIRLGTGVLAIRKGGKLPPPVYGETYDLEYGSATLEIPADGMQLAGLRVLLVDDVLATGGTLAAATKLLRTGGATVTDAAVVLELSALTGRTALPDLAVTSLYVV
ncbi:adenine phosphoribosyltransferase [Mycolicibacterium sp. P1-18]|nr:adenine phosphoribosyltransferase [Mycolicibacterium sp. P1-18]